MILASGIFNDIRALLDDDQSGRYDIPNDLVPAVNAAIDFWVSVLNAGFENKRIIHESLADLVRTTHYTAVVRESSAVVELSDDKNVWTIFGVDLKVKTVVNGAKTYYIGEGKKAYRVSLKEWSFEEGNPFVPGTKQSIPAEFQRAAYIGVGNYLGQANEKGILIKPVSMLQGDKLVLLWYLKNPDRVVDATSNIEFPASMRNMLVQKAVNYISFQHGGQTPYFQFTDKEITQLAQLLMI